MKHVGAARTYFGHLIDAGAESDEAEKEQDGDSPHEERLYLVYDVIHRDMMVHAFRDSEVLDDADFALLDLVLPETPERLRHSIAHELDLPTGVNNQTVNEAIEGYVQGYPVNRNRELLEISQQVRKKRRHGVRHVHFIRQTSFVRCQEGHHEEKHARHLT